MLAKNKTFRADVQVLRGVSVLAVLLFHAFEQRFPNGYLGVDIFFVISGFIVTPLIWNAFAEFGDSSTRVRFEAITSFYVRRFFRLAPAFAIALIFAYLLIFIFGPVSDHLRVASQGLASLLLLGNIGAYLYSGGNYFAPNPNPLVHLWSLSVEEQIYIFLPLTIFVFFFLFKKYQENIFITIIAVVGFASLIIDLTLQFYPGLLELIGIFNAEGFMFYNPISRVWEFVIGSLTFFLTNSTKLGDGRFRSILTVTSVLFIIFLFSPVQVTNQKIASLLVSIVSAVTIYSGVLNRKILVFTKIGKWLGDRSYSIYLLHMPLIYIAIYSPIVVINRNTAVIIAIILTLLVGNVFYSQIENRFRIKDHPGILSSMVSKKTLMAFVILPISLSLIFQNSARNSYWGLDPNPKSPIFDQLDDPSCYLEISPCEYVVGESIGKVLLIGDSHAAAIFQTFAKKMNSLSISAYGKQRGGCQFILRGSVSNREADLLTYNLQNPGESQSCFAHNKSIMEWVKLNPDALVVVSQRSSSLRPAGITQSAFQRFTLDNLRKLDESANKVIVIGPVPEFPDPQRVFQGSLLIWQKAYIPPKKVPQNKMISEPFVDNYLLQRFAILQEIGYINSIDKFCSNGICSRFQSGNWLYSDSEHLTPAGAKKLDRSLEEIVLNAIGPRS